MKDRSPRRRCSDSVAHGVPPWRSTAARGAQGYVTACRQHMRRLLLRDFAECLGRTQDALRTSMAKRLLLLRSGKVEQAYHVWTHMSEQQPATVATWERPEMWDVGNLILGAVAASIPRTLKVWLRRHAGPRTLEAAYRVLQRYAFRRDRILYVCGACRQHHAADRPGNPSRAAEEPLHEYLPMVLVVALIRMLLAEIREGRGDFKPPFPRLPLTESDYASWEHYAIRGVQEMLDFEREALHNQMLTGM